MSKTFEELLADTPKCNEFRRLADGTWVAYTDGLTAEGNAIRCIAPTIREALEGLRQIIT